MPDDKKTRDEKPDKPEEPPPPKKKVPEHPETLKKRSDWFEERHKE
jgi:hypothetical protein